MKRAPTCDCGRDPGSLVLNILLYRRPEINQHYVVPSWESHESFQRLHGCNAYQVPMTDFNGVTVSGAPFTQD